MEREAAIVEFFRTRLAESPDEGDLRLLERYDYCVAMECPGNEGLSWARREYEDEVFPARIARFADHPAYATLQGPWVPEDYANAVKAGSVPYRTCFECGHVYPTAADLLAAHVALVTQINRETSPDNPLMVAQTDPDRVDVCPACAHDF
jgi:hypothetical protein